MIQDARRRVREGAARIAAQNPAVPFDPIQVEEALAANLAEPLLTMTNRVMVLELNVARLEGILAGDTPQERFLSFSKRLSDAGVSNALLDEYRVLREQVATCLDKWEGFSLEFLEQLSDGWSAIQATLLESAPGRIVSLESGAGDTHRNGRSVVIVTFSSGQRLVYKPRSLAVDEHFQQLLAWLNGAGVQPRFRMLKIINRGNHGWVEFVHAHACASAEEVTRFYQRQGSYLAILYALEASDFHCENLIAAGEHPVLIDLEALFQPRLNEPSPKAASELAAAGLCYSVLRVGLLPLRFLDDEADTAIDLSGLGSAAGQLTPGAVPFWEDAGTDTMRIVRKRVSMPGSANRPLLNNEEINPLDHAQQIAAGFESTYRVLLDHRPELKGLLARFSNDEVRVIARPTQTYGTLLRESFHPDLLRDDDARLAFFDRLNEAVEQRPYVRQLIGAEREDLLRGDIPLFTTLPSSRDLWTSTGRRVGNYFRETGESLVERRIGQLSDEDLQRQLWIVRASLATMSNRVEGPPKIAKGGECSSRAKVSAAELIAAACGIGNRLSELAVGGDGDISWLGLIPSREREWRLSPLGLDLYDGLPGVALFLAQLGLISGDSVHSALARSAIGTVRRYLEESRAQEILGGFAGWGGIIDVLTRLGAMWADSSLIDEAEALLELLPPLIPRDNAYDIIGGSAGCALALKNLHEFRPSARIAGLANALGNHLLHSAQRFEGGLGWPCDSSAGTPLTGFAHGSAGIGHALLAIAELTGEDRFEQGALDAFDYERSLFSAEHRNWPDLRAGSGGGFATAWCHGAPGIALSRLCAYQRSPCDELRAEIDAALATTAQAFTGNHTLCHGELGNADILLTASEVLKEGRWREAADRIAASALDNARKSGWICGNPLGVESPGLMTGIAGIGYSLLRLAHPARVPSILALHAPVLL
jgi:type 2 lantibiotic biosynthesis protein LanM